MTPTSRKTSRYVISRQKFGGKCRLTQGPTYLGGRRFVHEWSPGHRRGANRQLPAGTQAGWFIFPLPTRDTCGDLRHPPCVHSYHILQKNEDDNEYDAADETMTETPAKVKAVFVGKKATPPKKIKVRNFSVTALTRRHEYDHHS